MPMLAISGTSINASSLITNLAISYLTISRIFVRATFCLNWWYMVISPLSFMSNSLCAHVEIEHASCLFCKKSVWAFNMRQGPKPSIFTFLQLQAFLIYCKHVEKISQINGNISIIALDELDNNKCVINKCHSSLIYTYW